MYWFRASLLLLSIYTAIVVTIIVGPLATGCNAGSNSTGRGSELGGASVLWLGWGVECLASREW